MLIWTGADVYLLGSEFLPTIDEGNMLVRATMPASISLPAAIDVSSKIEKTLLEHPFATLKMRMGATHFLMNTLPKVGD